MTESGAARPGDSQGRNLLQKHLGEILASQTLHPSIEKPRSMGRPSRRPTAIQAALRRRRAGDVWLGRCSKVWMRSNWMRWCIRRGTARLTDRRPQLPHDKSADERQSLETKPISRGTESSNPVPSSRQSGLSPEFACHRREAALFRQCCGPDQPARSAETGMTRRDGANGR